MVQVKVRASFNEEMMEPEVRRFSIDNEEATSFAALVDKIQNLFPHLQGQEFEVFWVDDELDHVVLSNDEELKEAVRLTADKDAVLHVSVNTLEDGQPEEQDAHVCQECHSTKAVFECSPCDNVKLCSKCKKNEVHKEHEVKRMESNTKPIFCGRFCKHRRFHRCMMGPRCIMGDRGGMMSGRGGMMGGRGGMMGGRGGMMGGRGGMMGGRGGMMVGRGGMMGDRGGMMGGRGGMMGNRGGMMGGHGGMMGNRGGIMGGCGGMMAGRRGMMGGCGGMMGGCEDMSTRGCMMSGRGCLASPREEMVA